MGSMVWAALLAGGAAALIALAISALRVRRLHGHLHRLLATTQRIVAGEATRLELSRGDPLLPLGSVIRSLADQRDAARRRAAAEAAGRTQAVESLRHANRLATSGTLSAGIAHECGTILSVISGRAQMIAKGEVSGEEAAQSAGVVLEQCQRITDLLQQLLGFARRRRKMAESVPIDQLVRQSMSLLAPLARKRGVSLEVRGDSEDRVKAAPALQQALTNLVVNGIQAMPDGGRLLVSVGEESRPPPAGLGAAGDQFVCIAVEDEGVGIPPGRRQVVFEPFFTTKQTGEGTGLGLWLARDIVRERGGWIEVESTPGRGSRFKVYLPRGEEGTARAGALEA